MIRPLSPLDQRAEPVVQVELTQAGVRFVDAFQALSVIVDAGA